MIGMSSVSQINKMGQPELALDGGAPQQRRTTLGRLWSMLCARVRTSWAPHSVWLAPGLSAEPAPIGSEALSGASPELAMEAWCRWCDAHAGSCVELGLSGHWLWSTVPDMPADSGSGARLQATSIKQARMQWSHYLGYEEAALDEAWLWRAVPAAGSPLVCALPYAVLDALQDVAQAHHVSLQWAGPWWLRGVQVWMASSEGDGGTQLCAVEPGLVTHLERSVGGEQPSRLVRVWTERTQRAGQGAPNVDEPGGIPGRVVAVAEGMAPLALLDDPELAALLSGRDAAWGARS
jgi:hypothetical protein